MNRSSGFIRGLLVLLTGLLVLLIGLQATLADILAAELPEDLPGTLHLATYHATAFSQHETGTLLWLSGAEGLMRLEIRRGQISGQRAGGLSLLLEQHGQGWTAILNGNGDDTLNAWGEQWRRPPTGMGRAVHLVSQALLQGPAPATGGKKKWRAGISGARLARHRIPSLREDPASRPTQGVFRQSQTHRGWGRGGTDDVLELAWVGLRPGENRLLQAKITRLPGRLEFAYLGGQTVVYAFPEAFVPLWPLAQLVTLSD